MILVPVAATVGVHLLKIFLRDLVYLETHLLFLYGVLIFATWYGGRTGALISLLMSVAFLRFNFLDTNIEITNLDILFFFLEGLLIALFTNSYFNELYLRTRQSRELLQARNRLQQAYSETNRILTSISDAFITLDKDYRISYINPAAAELVRQSPDNLLGRDFFQEFRFRDQNKLKQMLVHASISDEHGQLVTGIDSRQYLDLHYYSHFPATSIFINDVSEQKLLDKRKDEFIHLTSHELKTPLTTLKALTELLQSKYDSLDKQKQLHFLKNMEDQVNSLQSIVNNLLDVARIRSDKMALERKVIELDPFMADTIDDLRLAFPDREINLSGSTGKHVFIDPPKIRQVLTNLVRNAVVHARESRKINVKVEPANGHQVKIAVQDFGPGIEPEIQKYIFDSYFQSSKPAARQGLGLGLYISKRIVELHRGRISLKSRLKQGSTFCFTLPVAGEGK